MNGYFRTIAGGLIVVSIHLMAKGAQAAASPMPSAPDPCCSIVPSLPQEETASPKPGWPPSLPAAKAADVCESVDVASLEGDALIDYLRTTSEGCLERTLLIVDNPSIKKDVPIIFSDRNLQSVFGEIEKSAPAYDGTNSTGMGHLWFFVEVGYSYHRYFPGETGVGPFDAATDRSYLVSCRINRFITRWSCRRFLLFPFLKGETYGDRTSVHPVRAERVGPKAIAIDGPITESSPRVGTASRDHPSGGRRLAP